MLKYLPFLAFVACCSVAMGQNDNHDKNTVRHAVKHAAHWVNHHVSAPHVVHHHYPKRGHTDRSVHHTAVHAEHWINHHVNPPSQQHP